MAAALALTEHYVVVTTEHDGQAKAALTAAGYQLAAGTPVKLLLAPDQSVADVLAVLQQQHITVTDVQHQDADLEQIVLTLLASSKAWGVGQMITLYRQELRKLLKKQSTWWCPGILIALAVTFASLARVNAKLFPAKALFNDNFETGQFLVFFIMGTAAAMVTMEYQYGTIKTVLTQSYTRGQVLVSKWLTMLTYSLILYVGTLGLTLLLKVSLLNDKFMVFAHPSFWKQWLAATAGDFMNTWLLLSLVLLVATGFKRSGTAVAVGIVGYFLLSLVNVPMIALIKKYAWLKWNPINMFNYASQLRVASLSHVTKLSNMQFFWGNLVYIGLFLALGWLLFRRREV